jgi:hypothetical protein
MIILGSDSWVYEISATNYGMLLYTLTWLLLGKCLNHKQMTNPKL